MRRIAIFIVLGILLLLPMVLVVVQRRNSSTNSVATWPLTKKTQSPERYTVTSDDPRYTITLLDTRYLDYVADNVGIFTPQGVVDPESYQGGSRALHTISRVKFAIVPAIAKLLVAVPGQKELASMGDYTVQGDTLVIRVSFNPAETVALGSGQHALEDMFLRAALQTVHYAHGLSTDPRVNAETFGNIQSGIKEYLYNGVLPWPIRIETK